MKAAFCVEARKVVIKQVPEPDPQEGEALVKVDSCGVCGSDLHCYLGAFPPPPECMGHEISGTVAKSPTNSNGFKEGDRVVVEPIITCGACSHCRSGHRQRCPALRLLGTTAPGGFAEFVAVPKEALYPVPESLDLRLAALAEPTAVAIHACRIAGVQLGQRILVLGAGTIGLLAGFVAKMAGAIVAVTARHPHQQSLAEALGASVVFQPEEKEAVASYCSSQGVDLIIETVGGQSNTFSEALDYVIAGGQVVTLGVFTRSISINPLQFTLKEAQVKAAVFYDRSGKQPDFALALDLLSANAQTAGRLVTHQVSLQKAAEAFALAADKSRGAVKVLVRPDLN